MKGFSILFFTICLSLLSNAQQLVLPGSYPDPSVVKIGNKYWASSTTSNWFPAFPLLSSDNLVNWKQQGYIFNKLPDWADYYFWAPEISYDNGKVYVYYTAHKKNGSLCVAVASADRPEGPYTDHGPLVCQENGSIDAFPMRDENGKLYLIWKEDANSVGLPTPIWAAEMNEERTAIIGERKELFRNAEPWEQSLVEGVSIIRHGEYFYALYAAAGCCGTRCNYITGVARSKKLLGPWEKYEGNPVLIDSEKWICKGHGTAIEKDGKYYFFYHGYDRATSAFTGRQGLLQEFKFTKDGWVQFVNTYKKEPFKKRYLFDDFNSNLLWQTWQWSVFDDLKYEQKQGQLHLFALNSRTGSFIGQKPVTGDYDATAIVIPKASNAYAGLAAVGDDKNSISALYRDNKLRIIQAKEDKIQVLGIFDVVATDRLFLRMQVRDRFYITFLYSLDGKDYKLLNEEPFVGVFLPPWDSPPRVALVAKGARTQQAVFERFEMQDVGAIPPDNRRANKFLKILQIAFYILIAAGLIWLVVFYRKKIATRNKEEQAKTTEKVKL